MATKLKGLKIKRVALVDEGANPDAHIRFAKRRDDQQPDAQATENEITDEQAQGIAKRIADAIIKMFRPAAQTVEKDAHTFSETEAAMSYDVVMD